MPAMIRPSMTFKDNLQRLPSIDGVQRIDLVDGGGAVVASIENQPGSKALCLSINISNWFSAV